MIYRLKQFLRAITAKMNQQEYRFVQQYLSPEEATLFMQLKIDEQKHSLCVAKLMSELSVTRQEEYIKLGLLHDIGKIKYPLNPIEKGMMVVLDRITRGKVKGINGLKIVKGYYQHALEGYQLLSELGNYEMDFLEAVKWHHTPMKTTSELLYALIQCDYKA